MDTKVLEDLGLTKSEISVYLALLELGSSSTGKIVEKSKAASSKVYEVLDKLIQKGLVSFVITSGVKQFEAAPASRIWDYVKEREERLTLQKVELQKLVPQLELTQQLSKHRSEATIFKGIKGVKTAYYDILRTLKKGDEYYVMGATNPSEQYFSFIKHFHKERAARGIKVKILYSEPVQQIANTIKDIPLTMIKFAPQELFSSAFVLMYANKTLISVATKNDITVFMIESQEVTDSLKAHFMLIWNQEAKTLRGIESIKEIFRQTLDYSETCFIGGKGYIVERDPDFFFNEYVPEAQKRHHQWKNLVQPNKIVREIAALPFVEIRYLPQTYLTPHVIFIFGDYVANVLWEKEPLAYLIHNKDVAQSYRDYFELLWNPENKTLQGFEGIVQLCQDVLSAGEDLYLIGANGALYERHKQFFIDFDKKRIEKGIKRHHLSLERTRGSPINKQPSTEVRYLPSTFGSPMVIWIFGNTVANILWDDQVVYVTTNKKVADDYRKYFGLLWKQAKV